MATQAVSFVGAQLAAPHGALACMDVWHSGRLQSSLQCYTSSSQQSILMLVWPTPVLRVRAAASHLL